MFGAVLQKQNPYGFFPLCICNIYPQNVNVCFCPFPHRFGDVKLYIYYKILDYTLQIHLITDTWLLNTKLKHNNMDDGGVDDDDGDNKI